MVCVQDIVNCLFHQHRRLGFFQNLLLGGQARFKRKAFQQLAANAIDCSDACLPNGVGKTELALFE